MPILRRNLLYWSFFWEDYEPACWPSDAENDEGISASLYFRLAVCLRRIGGGVLSGRDNS